MHRPFQAATLMAFLAFPSTSVADQLSEEWQTQRDIYNEITDRVCAGDVVALQDLNHYAWQMEIPAALHNIAWLYSSQAECPTTQMGMTYDADAAIDAQIMSALAGYPVGQFGYAMMLIEGKHGVQRNPELGVEWLDKSRRQGFASASEQLALIIAQGLYGFPQEADLARMLVQEAEDLGLSGARVADLRNDVEYYLANVSAPSSASLAPTIFNVTTHLGQDHPKLGDRSNAGSYLNQVVYVAQGFEILPDQGGCWRPTSDFMVGIARIAVTANAADDFDLFLELAETQRANSYNTSVEEFASLDEGIRFRTDNSGNLSNTGEIRWSLAEAESRVRRCEGTQTHVIYPSPIRERGY